MTGQEQKQDDPRPEAPANPALQRLAALAARLLAASASQVSLLSEVQTIGAVAGQDLALVGSTGVLVDSLCTVTAAHGAPLVVSDAAHDERVASLPPVTSGAVGAYLGVPLLGHDGQVVGALCVFDPTPRAWQDADVELLSDLAVAAAAELKLSALSLGYDADRLRWQLAVAAGGVGSFDWDLRTGELSWDAQLLEMFGYDGADFGRTIEDFDARVHPEDRGRVAQALEEAIAACGPYEAEYRVVLPGASPAGSRPRGRRWLVSTGGRGGCWARPTTPPAPTTTMSASRGCWRRCRRRSTPWTGTGASPTSTPKPSGCCSAGARSCSAG